MILDDLPWILNKGQFDGAVVDSVRHFSGWRYDIDRLVMMNEISFIVINGLIPNLCGKKSI